MGRKRFIDCTMPVSQDEAQGTLSKISELPMAMPLVKLFQRASNENSYRKTVDGHYGIYANPNLEDVCASLSIRQFHQHVSVDFYPCKFDNLEHESERYGYYELATINAGPKRTGIWCYGQGEQTAYGISVKMRNELLLPSNQVRWIFEQLSWFSVITGEYLNISQQPKFWTGDKERPD